MHPVPRAPIPQLILLCAAAIWGFAFVAQKTAMAHMGPFAFVAIRFLLGAVFVVSIGLLAGRFRLDRRTLIGGSVIGILLFIGSSLQQIGMLMTTAGKGGFITGLYLVFVPLFNWTFGWGRVPVHVWGAVVLCTIGLYLLSMTGGISIDPGDGWVLGCAVVFAIHLIAISYWVSAENVMALAGMQFFVSSILGAIFSFTFEAPSWQGVTSAWAELIYAGIISAGLAYTLQVFAQRFVSSTSAAILLGFESVFAALGGGLLLGEELSSRQALGCLLILIGGIGGQIPGETVRRVFRQGVRR